MSNNTHYFHFTLGPVQGFVSQARRTRDFWAGSFILSWLSAVAIKAVEHQGGTIKFPHADPDYMSWLVGKESGLCPKQGSIPNRFKGLMASVDPATFQPESVTAAVQEAWKVLADKVWECDLGHVSPSAEAATIWDRQIAAFWDMSWVITPDVNDGAVLDKRKNWRSYMPPDEPGVKCAMMDGWQELSGEERPNRKAMNQFWDVVRAKGRQGIESDLKAGEALCAMAFVKRRFSRHFGKVDHQMKQGWTLKGWTVPSAVPSVAYMAAVHWFEQALEKADANKLETFYQEAIKLTGNQHGEYATRIQCLDAAWGNRDWKSLDGNVFFDSALSNKNIFEDQQQAQRVLQALKAVNKSADDLDPVSPFYAVLMMDGDSLGSHMSDLDKQKAITNGLAAFTKGVPGIVVKHNGFLIYAGGDDVLAVLPLEDAIDCAAELRAYYLKCFAGAKNIPTTLSGAIEFAHIKMPLTKVLKDAHQLLDDVAKDGSGRDALAIRVWKPGGMQLEWSQPWSVVLDKSGSGSVVINELVKGFQENLSKDAYFSSKFFFKIRERFDLLNPVADKDESYQPSLLNRKQAIDLMTMEYLNSWGSSKHKNEAEACELVEKLLVQCAPVKRQLDAVTYKESFAPAKGKDVHLWEVDGALLVRFLAHKGVE